MVKQTAGRDQLGEFAPKFAELNDDVLFGEVWSREGKLSLKTRSILTVSALVSKGLIDSSFQFHVQSAKKNGVTKDEMAEILTHLAGVKHWHGAAKDSWFSHVAFEAPGEDCSTEWCEPVDEARYGALEG